MKVVLPVAGIGSRLRPHTNTTPKPLIEVAGKSIISHIIDKIERLESKNLEYVFVVGYKKDLIIDYIQKNYPNLNVSFVEQKIRDGDGGAIKLALEKIKEKNKNKDDDLLIFFGDILIDFDLNDALEKNKENLDLIFTKYVDDPTHYGIVKVDKNNLIKNLEEKPKNPSSNLAIIGTYYFNSYLKIEKYLNEIYKNKQTIKGEYKLAKVIENLINNGEKIFSYEVKKWFDCGRASVLLEANKYFLTKYSKGKIIQKENFIIIPPCYISKNAIVERAIIGPYVSVGSGAVIKNSIVENSIISSNTKIKNAILKNSIFGKNAKYFSNITKINLGDNSEIENI